MYMFYENKYIYNLQGGLGAIPPQAEEIFKKSNEMMAFPLFFCFLAGLPRSPKL